MNKEDAITYIEEWLKDEYSLNEKDKMVLKMSLKALEQEQRWIPCSERFPKEHLCDDGYVEPSDYVLVYGGYGNYGVSRYWGNRKSKAENPNSFKDWIDLDWIAHKPIAWQSLPKPYKENESEPLLNYADQDTMKSAT